MRTRHSGFVLAELLAVAAVGLALLALAAPMARHARQVGGLSLSLQNVGEILTATAGYRADHAGAPPQRMTTNSSCTIMGWDSWNFGGKNNAAFWATGSSGVFDESAYARRLNWYAYAGQASVPAPPGYVNCNPPVYPAAYGGHPTTEQRNTLQIPLFRSPGDTATYQRNWPNPTAGVTGYDDVGTSYLLNMRWFDVIRAGPPVLSFNDAYLEGYNRIRNIESSPYVSEFVWIWDQRGDINALTTSGLNGEFLADDLAARDRKTVCGFLDGHAAYIPIRYNVLQGPGYRLVP